MLATWVARSRSERADSAFCSAEYASSRAFACCTFSAEIAIRNDSASFSRRRASELAMAIFASFSPLIATALASEILIRLSRSASALPIDSNFLASAIPTVSSFLASAMLISLSFWVIAIFTSLSRCVSAIWVSFSRSASALPVSPIFSCSATLILASFIALAAASLPSASI